MHKQRQREPPSSALVRVTSVGTVVCMQVEAIKRELSEFTIMVTRSGLPAALCVLRWRV